MNISRLKISVSKDNIILLLWSGHLLINVFTNFINNVFTGFFNIVLMWLFLLYFCLIYGRRNEWNSYSNFSKNAIMLFILFLVTFVPMRQFLYNDSNIYKAFDINFSSVVWNMFSFFPEIVSSIMIVKKSDKNNVRFLRNCIMLFSFVVFIRSSLYLMADGNAAKYTATGSSEYIPFFFDFASIYAFAIVIPFLICYLTKKRYKITILIYLVVIIWGIATSSFFIATMAVVLGLVIFLIFKIEKKWLRTLLMIVVGIIVIVVMLSGVYLKFFAWLAEVVPFEEISKRISQLILYANNGTIGDTTGRISLYLDSIIAIAKHPITGNIIWNPNCFISGHSTILDIWNGSGLIVLGILILSACSVIRLNKTFCSDSKQLAALFASNFAFVFVALFNPVFASPAIVVLWILSPMIFSGYDLKKCNTDINFVE